MKLSTNKLILTKEKCIDNVMKQSDASSLQDRIIEADKLATSAF